MKIIDFAKYARKEKPAEQKESTPEKVKDFWLDVLTPELDKSRPVVKLNLTRGTVKKLAVKAWIDAVLAAWPVMLCDDDNEGTHPTYAAVDKAKATAEGEGATSRDLYCALYPHLGKLSRIFSHGSPLNRSNIKGECDE